MMSNSTSASQTVGAMGTGARNTNAIRKWTAFSQQPNKQSAAKRRNEQIVGEPTLGDDDEEGEGAVDDELEEAEASDDEDDSTGSSAAAKRVAKARQEGVQLGASVTNGHNHNQGLVYNHLTGSCFDYDHDSPYQMQCNNGGSSNAFAMGANTNSGVAQHAIGNALDTAQGHQTPESSPNSSPYSSVSSAKNYQIAHLQQTTHQNNNCNQLQQPHHNQFALHQHDQMSGYQQPQQPQVHSHRYQDFPIGQPNYAGQLDHTRPMYYSSQQAPNHYQQPGVGAPTGSPYLMAGQQLQQQHLVRSDLSSQQCYASDSSSMLHAVNLSYPVVSQQSVVYANHWTRATPGSAVNNQAPPAEIAPSTAYGNAQLGAGSHGHFDQQEEQRAGQAHLESMQLHQAQPGQANNSTTSAPSTGNSNNMQQLYELQSAHDLRQHQGENLIPLDVTKNHDNRRQDGFQSCSSPNASANNQQQAARHGSPMMHNNSERGYNPSAYLQQAPGNQHQHLQQHPRLLQQHPEQHLQHQVRQQQPQQLFQAGHFDQQQQTSRLANSNVQQQMNFQQDNSHAAPTPNSQGSSSSSSSTCSVKSASSPSSSGCLKSTSCSETTGNYNGVTRPSNEYNLTTLQATRSLQAQNQYTGVTQQDSIGGSAAPTAASIDQRDNQTAAKLHQDSHNYQGQQLSSSSMNQMGQQQRTSVMLVSSASMTTGKQNPGDQVYSSANMDSIVKSFPTPELSPLDSLDKSGLFSAGSRFCTSSQFSDAQKTNQQHSFNSPSAVDQQAEGETGSGGSSAVSQLIARFGDQSSVLRDVQPPYKYRMIVNTSVAGSLSDHSIQQQMRDSCQASSQQQTGNQQLQQSSQRQGVHQHRNDSASSNSHQQHTGYHQAEHQHQYQHQQQQQQQQQQQNMLHDQTGHLTGDNLSPERQASIRESPNRPTDNSPNMVDNNGRTNNTSPLSSHAQV